MNISILLPTYNRAHIIEECILGVLTQSYKEWELIILDDASDDNTREIGEKYQLKDSRITYIRNESRLNLLGNKNKGIKISKYPFVFIIEDDLILEEKCLENLSKIYLHLIEKHHVGAIAPRLTSLVAEKPQSIDKPFIMSKYSGEIWNNYDIDGEEPVETFTLHACSLIPKVIIDEVGGFSSGEYIGNCFREETDFYFRIRKKGYKLFFVPQARALHKNEIKGGCKLDDKFKMHYYCIRNHFIFLNKHYGIKSYFMLPCFIVQHIYYKVILEFGKKMKAKIVSFMRD